MAGVTREVKTKMSVDGEQAYKKAMTEINSGLKVLSSEMKLTTAQFKGQANSIEALTAKHDGLSRQILSQKEKVDKLKDALRDSARINGEADERTKAWQISLNNAERGLIGMYDELGKTEKHMEEAAKSTDKCATSIDEFGRETEKAEEKTSKFGEIFKGAFWANLASRALTAVISKVKEFASSSIQAADKFGTLAEIYGLTSDRIQELEFAGIRLDVSLETITGSMTKLVRNMNTARAGSKLQVEAFRALDIEITNTDGSLRDANTVFGEAIDALGAVGNETERDAIAMQLFGKSAMEMNPLIKAGSAELAALSEKAHEMGAVMSEDAVNALDNLDETLQEIKMSAQAFVGEALAAIIGDGKTAAEVMDGLQESLSNTGNTQQLIDKFHKLNAELSSGALTADEAKKKNAELEEVKKGLIEVSGGVVTAFDIENGTFEKQIGVLEELTQAEKDYLKHKLTAQILENSGAQLKEKESAATKKFSDAQKGLTAEIQLQTSLRKAIASGESTLYGETNEEMLASSEKMAEGYRNAMQSASTAQAELSESSMAAASAAQELVADLGSTSAAAEQCGMSVEEFNVLLANTGETSENIIPEVQALSESIDLLNAEYEEAKITVQSTLDSIVGGWGEVPAAVAVSAEEVVANLQSQMDWMASYRDNLDALMSRQIPGVDTSALIASLSDGSAESAAILAGLNTATDAQVAKIAESMAGVEVGKESFVNSIAAAQINYDERMADMVKTTTEAVAEMDLSDDAKESALNTINGYINGVRAQSGSLNLAMTKAAQDALNAWKKVFKEASPSRAMMESGENAIKGAVIGVENEQGKLVSLYTTMGEKLLTGLSKGMKDSSGKVMETADDITKELAKRVGDIVNVFSTSADIADLQYKLWELSNPDATATERTAQQVDSLNKQIDLQRNTINSVSDAYKKMVEMTGENSDESLKLQKQLLQEQIELEKLRGSVKDLTEEKQNAYNVDNLTKMAEQEFKLWSLENQRASDGEKLAKQAELLALKYEMQGENISTTESALADMVEQYGANSAESVKLQEQLLKEKIAYMELKAQIDEVNRARGYVGGSNIGASGYLQTANIWAGMKQTTNTDISSLGSIGKQDIGGMIAGAVNAMSAPAQAPIVIQNPLYINGKELARATVSDFRAVEASSPQVRSDRL